ncbi:MAG: prepilin-type N-terminal cleavage/methylation domain-containing protein [Kofleriaceae bacterium]
MKGQKGFTLVEVMIACAVLAILAAIAIPMFSGQSRKAKADTEVVPMFAELAIRQEQYKVDNSRYLTTAGCPASPSAVARDATSCVASGQPWNTLLVQLPTTKLRCSYAVTTGLGDTTVTNPSSFTFSSPPIPWYYIIATCDMDGSSAVTSMYFTSSVDSSIQKQNEGK